MKYPFAFLFALLPLLAQSTWIDSTGKPLPDTESMRSAGDFGVQIILTTDEKQLRQTWNSAGTTPTLNTSNTIQISGSITALLIFHGCELNTCGVCDVASEFTLESPDGGKISAGGGPVWTEEPGQLRQLQLGQVSLKLDFDSTDPAGNYSIIADVKDKVSGQALSVRTRLKITK